MDTETFFFAVYCGGWFASDRQLVGGRRFTIPVCPPKASRPNAGCRICPPACNADGVLVYPSGAKLRVEGTGSNRPSVLVPGRRHEPAATAPHRGAIAGAPSSGCSSPVVEQEGPATRSNHRPALAPRTSNAGP